MNILYDLIKQWRDEDLFLPIWVEDGKLKIIDQIKLPFEESVITINKVEELATAIKDMTIRGSGAIGISGAYGLLLVALQTNANRDELETAATFLKSTRPTAVNLMKTIDRLVEKIEVYKGNDLLDYIILEVTDILVTQLDYEYLLGKAGAELINDGDTILTHCHSGALAGSGFGGRALSVIRTAHNQGKNIHVFTSETRPYLQGARITAYELDKFKIPHTLITDGMSGYLMRLGKIQKVVVGSDRIAQNGDLINKIGTYMHALAAKANNIPFYTATSSHTIDFDLSEGMNIGVEFRDENEVTSLYGQRIAPPNTKALYPSFDVTPNEIISGIITEKGVIITPFGVNLKKLSNN